MSDILKGSVCDPHGLDVAELLHTVRLEGNLHRAPAPYRGWDALRTIEDAHVDAVIEVSYTDLRTGEPAFTYMKRALELGKHVVTSNKGPIALHYPKLAAIARRTGAAIGVEGTVMSGTPTLRLGRDLLVAAGIRRIQGILNGTTNFILGQMEKGASYKDALSTAQEAGSAEADPTADVEGIDAAGKVVILANLVLGASITLADVQREGISGLTSTDVHAALAADERWKLIGRVERTGGSIQASVKPIRIPLSHPLATVSGPTNAVTFTTDLLGDVTLVGPGAGRIETGYALVSDLLAIHRERARMGVR